MIEFAYDLITVDEWCIGGGGLVHTSKFSTFMSLKVVVCIGSDFVENVFSISLVGLGGRRVPGNVDVCPNYCVWAVGSGGMMLGRERMKYQRVVLLSLIGGGTMVRLPWVC